MPIQQNIPFSPYSAHAALAQALLGILLNLGDQVDKVTVEKDHLQFTRLGTGKSPRQALLCDMGHAVASYVKFLFRVILPASIRHGKKQQVKQYYPFSRREEANATP